MDHGYGHEDSPLSAACPDCPAKFHDDECMSSHAKHHAHTCTAVAHIAGALDYAKNVTRRSTDGTSTNAMYTAMRMLPVREFGRAMAQTRKLVGVSDVWESLERDGDIDRAFEVDVYSIDSDSDDIEIVNPIISRTKDIYMGFHYQRYDARDEGALRVPTGGSYTWRETFKGTTYELAAWATGSETLARETRISDAAVEDVAAWITWGPSNASKSSRSPKRLSPQYPTQLSPPAGAIGDLFVPLDAYMDPDSDKTDNVFGVMLSSSASTGGYARTTFVNAHQFASRGEDVRGVDTATAATAGVYHLASFGDDAYAYWTSPALKSSATSIDATAYTREKYSSNRIALSYAVLVVGRQAYVVGARYARVQPAIADETEEQYAARGRYDRQILRKLGVLPYADWRTFVEVELENTFQTNTLTRASDSIIGGSSAYNPSRTRIMYYLHYLSNVLELDRCGVANAAAVYLGVVRQESKKIKETHTLDAVAISKQMCASRRATAKLYVMPELISEDLTTLHMGPEAMAFDRMHECALMSDLCSLVLRDHPKVLGLSLGFKSPVGNITSCTKLQNFVYAIAPGEPIGAIPRLVTSSRNNRDVIPFCPLLTSVYLANVQLRRPVGESKSPFGRYLTLSETQRTLKFIGLDGLRLKGAQAELYPINYWPTLLLSIPPMANGIVLYNTVLDWDTMANLAITKNLRTLDVSTQNPSLTRAAFPAGMISLTSVTVAFAQGVEPTPTPTTADDAAAVAVSTEDDTDSSAPLASAIEAPAFRVAVHLRTTDVVTDRSTPMLSEPVVLALTADKDAYTATFVCGPGKEAMYLDGLLSEASRVNLIQDATYESTSHFEATATNEDSETLVVSLYTSSGDTLVCKTAPFKLRVPVNADRQRATKSVYIDQLQQSFAFYLDASQVAQDVVQGLGIGSNAGILIRTVLYSTAYRQEPTLVAVHVSVPSDAEELFSSPTAMADLLAETAVDSNNPLSAEERLESALPYTLTSVPGSPPGWFSDMGSSRGMEATENASRVHALWLATAWDQTSIFLAPRVDNIESMAGTTEVYVEQVPFDTVEGSVPLAATTRTVLRAPMSGMADPDWVSVVQQLARQPTAADYTAAIRHFAFGSIENSGARPFVLRDDRDPLTAIGLYVGDTGFLFSRSEYKMGARDIPVSVHHNLGPFQPASAFSFAQDGTGQRNEVKRFVCFEPLRRLEAVRNARDYCVVRMISGPYDEQSYYPTAFVYTMDINNALSIIADRVVLYASLPLPVDSYEDTFDPFAAVPRCNVAQAQSVWKEYPRARESHARMLTVIQEIETLSTMPRDTREERMTADAAEYEYRRENNSALLAIYIIATSIEAVYISGPATAKAYKAVIKSLEPTLAWIVRAIPINGGSEPAMDTSSDMVDAEFNLDTGDEQIRPNAQTLESMNAVEERLSREVFVLTEEEIADPESSFQEDMFVQSAARIAAMSEADTRLQEDSVQLFDDSVAPTDSRRGSQPVIDFD